MDSLTAGIILILLQFCIALVMAGVFFAAPTEKSTRYWAIAGTSIAIGALIAILNNREPRIFVLLTGSGLIIGGLIYQWFGVLACAWALCAAILLASPWLYRLIGRRGARALERLMGMLLLMVGVQMLLDGAKALWNT